MLIDTDMVGSVQWKVENYNEVNDLYSVLVLHSEKVLYINSLHSACITAIVVDSILSYSID